MFWRPLGIVLITIALAGAAACSNDTHPPSTATPAPSPDGGRPTQLSATIPPTQPPPGGIVFAIGGSLWRVNTDGSGLRRIAGANGAPLADASAPEFSPDGRLLAYVEAHHSVVVVSDVANRHAVEVYRTDLYIKDPLTPTGADNNDIGPFAVHWSPDGSLLLVTRRRTGGSGYTDVMLMEPDGSARRTVLDAQHLAPSFPEATWSASHAPNPPPPAIAVVSGADGTTGEAYDLQGKRIGAAYPSNTTRIAVALHESSVDDSFLVASSLGSPEPFGPIVVYDIAGASHIVGGGCGAAWSPDGRWLSYYDGYGIAVQRLDAASPDDHVYAARNAGVGLDASRQPANACDGVAITWRREPFVDSQD